MPSLSLSPVRALTDNYIWVLDNGADAVVVDPGEAAPVTAWLDARGLRLAAILITHHHGDHTGGVTDLCARAPVPVYGPAAESIAAVTMPLHEGDQVDLGTLGRFDVIGVGGHTRGHIAYYRAGDETAGAPGFAPVLFCGDTLFATGCGRLFEGTPAQMLESLSKLACLPGSTRVCCAHEYTLSNIRFALAADAGNAALQDWSARAAALREQQQPTVPTTIAHELRTNPFLACTDGDGAARLAPAASRQAGRALDDAVDIFAALRAWKNEFR